MSHRVATLAQPDQVVKEKPEKATEALLHGHNGLLLTGSQP